MSNVELKTVINLATSEEAAYARTNEKIDNEIEEVYGRVDELNERTNQKIDSEIEGVNNRVDNIIAHGSSTAGNTELIDIRTGYDGNVYQLAGTAVRSQIEYLKLLHDRTEGQINLFNKEAFTPDCEYHTDTRQIIPNSKGYGLSEMIPVTAGDVLFYSKDGTEFNVEYTYGFDISGNYVDGSKVIRATSYTVPQGAAFIRVCTKTENIDLLQIEYDGVSDYKPFTNMGEIVGSLKNIDSRASEFSQKIERLKLLHDRTEGQMNLFDKEAFTPDCEYNTDTRQITPNSKGYGLSEMIPVNVGDVLFYSKDGTEFNVEYTYGFDVTGEYVDGSKVIRATSYTVPQGAAFIRICTKTENIDLIQIEYNGVSDYKPFENIGKIAGSLKNIDSRVSELEDIVNPQPTTSPLAVIEKYPSFISCFMNVGCIGDSLASGVAVSKNAAGEIIVNSKNRYEYSWGQYLARMTGNNYYNWSSGGLRTDTWLTSDYAELCYDGEHLCQAYIIGLGQNDNNKNHGSDLGTASDIDITDYNNNNNTFYGRYAKIIQKIQEITPKAKIFVITDPNDSVNANGYNTAIRDIAGMFNNVYLIDMREYMNTAPCATLLQNQMRYGHFNAVGYFLIAKMLMTYIDYIIEQNPDDFREIENIGTEYHWYD